jgi:uncharacterized protein DUF6134
MRGSILLASVGILAALASSIPLSGSRAATQVLTYTVEHPTYGTIGTYTNIVSQNGNAADVRTDLHVAVRAIGIPLFHQDATREEHWQGQRLVAFDSTTDDNGTKIVVTGQADRSGFIIRSTSNGTLTAPPQVHPSNPWAPFLLHTDTIMSTKTGRVVPVVVTDTGEVTANFHGRSMRVHQWFVDGDKHQVVWIDGSGVVVAFQTQENGSTINFVLKNQIASAPPGTH